MVLDLQLSLREMMMILDARQRQEAGWGTQSGEIDSEKHWHFKIDLCIIIFVAILYFIKGTTTSLMTSKLHRLWCFFVPKIYRKLQGEVARYFKETHHERCSCDVINEHSYIVLPLKLSWKSSKNTGIWIRIRIQKTFQPNCYSVGKIMRGINDLMTGSHGKCHAGKVTEGNRH